jgi:transcriptional regulator with XRE-family HTH domain
MWQVNLSHGTTLLYPLPVNIETRDRLIKIVKQARGDLSRRSFARLLKVSPTAVQFWETGESMPATENLAHIAQRTGYSLEELIGYLEGKPLPEPEDLDRIVRQIHTLPLSQVAVIGKAVSDRFLSELQPLKIRQ